MWLPHFHQLKYSHMEEILVTSHRFVLAKLFAQIKLGVGAPAILNVYYFHCTHTFYNDVRTVFSYRTLQPSLEHLCNINKRTNSHNCTFCNSVLLSLYYSFGTLYPLRLAKLNIKYCPPLYTQSFIYWYYTALGLYPFLNLFALEFGI
jgi:hypothetical protein